MAAKDMKTMFAEMADRLAKKYQPKDKEPPGVKSSVVEMVAGQMAERGYEMTPKALEILTDYLKGYNLWLCGNVGVGKTFFFEVMIETMGWTMDNARDWAVSYKDDDVLLDDVGSEPVMNSYGVKAELFPYLLEKRMQLTNRRTHITSNLGPKDILARYDVRVSDRFVQMFKFERFESKKSRRETRPWKTPRHGGGLL